MKQLVLFTYVCFHFLGVFAQSKTDDFRAVDTLKPYALVAGGSKGIGFGIADTLGKRGYNLILIARHLDTLQAAKAKLEALYPIHVDILVMDLSFDSCANAIAKWCTKEIFT